MRWTVNLLALVMVAGVVLAVVLGSGRSDVSPQEQEAARAATARFQREIALRSALATPTSAPSFPASVDPDWFDARPPLNPLLEPHHPWVEIAPRTQRHLTHPPDRVAAGSDSAGFWYNPALGIVRARVPVCDSDERALLLYNAINGCALTQLFGDTAGE
jgi:hypothetical protein